MKIEHEPHSLNFGNFDGHDYSGLDLHASPHECSIPNCPGNLNRQKLELFDEMLAALEGAMIMWKSAKPRKLDDALTWRQNDENAELAAFKAIAKAKDLQVGGRK